MSKEDLAAKMEVLVKQYRKSDQTRKAFAQAHGISEPKLDYWIQKFSRKAGHQASLFGSDPLVIRLPSGVEIQIPL